MRTIQLPVPMLATVAATRAVLGVGVGLLAGPSIPERVRRPLGWSLVALGALSTIPLARGVFARHRRSG
jgi:hypothetical protein